MTRWQTPLCPLTIEFAPDKLDEIRLAVIDGFYAVPRGGVEIAGVLFGKRTEAKLEVLDYRKIETEYVTGPSFRPSEKDLAGVRSLLAETKFKDSAVQPLGWFVSRTRATIHLPEKDLEFYKQFFPEAWQVTLVLKPEIQNKVRGGYFFREAGGSVKADASVSEFVVEAYFGEKRASLELVERVAQELVVEEPVVEPMLTPERAAPVIPEPAMMFQAAAPAPSWSRKTQILLPFLVGAAIAAAVAGYWFAGH
jgi:hypothetical protein